MKLQRKSMMLLGIAAACVLIVSLILYFGDRSNPAELRGRGAVENASGQPLVQIGPVFITEADLIRYKEHMQFTSATPADDPTLVKELAIDQLMLYLADAQGLTATREEGVREAERMRKTLQEQPSDVQEQHAKFIDELKVNEETYWEEYAAPFYQEQLSKEKLVSALVAKQKEDGRDVIATGQALRNELLEAALKDGTVKVLDPDMQW
ncbi:hypothetical protein NST08_02530 [Paenibacillus sp. FSL K6-1566]|uniref:Peptidylprolyl isomerase n=1 Tax=Paenibacillus lactis TaxID=228574 RepID=A0ABS4F695_9BACL|nr:hypothetical protein [Paenibacillus lactis]MBP1891771.1 hypothetical protein [Paenibacillus lactis]MCM3494229.1 ABC transporter permease [Paenibacillus lactis]HAF99219.1 hypothetical protein [Paenibacillus lactis]